MKRKVKRPLGQSATRSARGVTVAQLKRVAATIPGLEESTSYGTLAFKLKKKLVARMREDGDRLVLAMDFVNRDLLMHDQPEIFHLEKHYLDYPYVLVRLGNISATVLKGYLVDACTFVRKGR